MSALRLSFPATVNEKAARTVAAVVAPTALVGALTGMPWVPLVLAVGFALRVGWGPRFSPLARLAAYVVAPRLGEPKMVAGAPKRFAQGVGLAVTGIASIAALAGWGATAATLLGVLAVFAALEAALGFCAGCWAYGQLAARGVIDDASCVECADLTQRPRVGSGVGAA